MRQKDHAGVAIKNSNERTFSRLIQALSEGDCVVLFPEGISRFYPNLAPLRSGSARLASQVLTKHATDPSFELVIATVSITYTRREKFRSNVLMTFNEPIVLTPQAYPDLIQGDKTESAIKNLTDQITERLRSGCLDAPSWKILRLAHAARRLYAPASAYDLSLGEYIRLTQRFVDIFAAAATNRKTELLPETAVANKDVLVLEERLKAYQDRLASYGIKDYRILVHAHLPNSVLLKRLLMRLITASILCLLASPGLVLWLPVLLFTKRQERRFRKKGPRWDVFDEISQTKLVYGLLCTVAVWIFGVLLTLPFAIISFWGIPLTMLIGLRFYEDLASVTRGILALSKLFILHNRAGGHELENLWEERQALESSVVKLAVASGMPADYKEWLKHSPSKRLPLTRRLSAQLTLKRREFDYNDSLRLWQTLDREEDDDEIELAEKSP